MTVISQPNTNQHAASHQFEMAGHCLLARGDQRDDPTSPMKTKNQQCVKAFTGIVKQKTLFLAFNMKINATDSSTWIHE